MPRGAEGAAGSLRGAAGSPRGAAGGAAAPLSNGRNVHSLARFASLAAAAASRFWWRAASHVCIRCHTGARAVEGALSVENMLQ